MSFVVKTTLLELPSPLSLLFADKTQIFANLSFNSILQLTYGTSVDLQNYLDILWHMGKQLLCFLRFHLLHQLWCFPIT